MPDSTQFTRCSVRVQGTTLDEYTDEDILDCDAYREFWLSWDGDRISLGKGIYSFSQYVIVSRQLLMAPYTA